MSHEIQLGSRGPDVKILKTLLAIQIGVGFRNDGTDVFDLTLQRTVITFQTSKLLRNTAGIVDAETWQALGVGIPDSQLRRLESASPGIYEVIKNGGVKNFVIVYGDAGQGTNNTGALFPMAASTHVTEISTRTFPNVPQPSTNFKITDPAIHISTVSDLASAISIGNIAYLAYFGHSWNSGIGSLYIGGADAPDTNLSNGGGVNDTPVSRLSKGLFRSDAQIRLFGCQGGFGSNSIAQHLATELNVQVFAYANSGGSLFTHDRELGQGRRAVTKADISFNKFEKTKPTWLIPINGRALFTEF
jgi:peptidoglycan hydrolase-like protein with peptidoglycan-binding domain